MRWKLRAFKAALHKKKILKLLGSHASAVLADTRNGRFLVDPEDMGVGRSLLTNGSYGDGELERLLPHLTKQSDVLVVGAHVGALVVPLARACNTLVAVEANPRNFDLLRANLTLNGSLNVRTIHAAANDTKASLEFLLSRANSGGSKRMPVHRDI
ncbi:MAG TPA: FkbM family methyltransferase, partial [Nitrospirales bacterium]|nr:FkbM family methyltransferase [Nitrospirales bacterium]